MGNPPFGILENGVFKLTELVVEGWLAVLQNLHRWGDWGIVSAYFRLGTTLIFSVLCNHLGAWKIVDRQIPEN